MRLRCGQHHVERRRGADQAWQAHAAAPARIDPEFHFRQADAGGLVVAGHAIPAGQRQLGAAAHAVPADGGHGRAAQFGQALVDQLAAADPVLDLALGGDLLEALDVGAGDEAGRLAGADHHAFRRIDRDALDHGVQFVDHRAGQRIDVLIGPVEGQDQETVASDGRTSNSPGAGRRTWRFHT